MKRFVRSAARRDIQRQFRYYLVERDVPDVALRFLDAVEEALNAISRDPGIGSPRLFPDLPGLRSWPVPGFEDIRVYYVETPKVLRIIRILTAGAICGKSSGRRMPPSTERSIGFSWPRPLNKAPVWDTRSMGSSAKDLYETDFVAWSERNAELLREGRFEDADLAHIIEEIEDLGGDWERALDSHTCRLLAHLLKWEYQPAYPGRGAWKNTITAQRIEAHKLLRRAPSLKKYFRENLAENYADAVRLAASETGLPRTAFPSPCPYTVEQILDDEFLPGA